jgi:ferredoxin
MSDKTQKVAESVAGPYFVDVTCIDCDLCRETAPANFTRNDEQGYSFVVRQPENPAEEAACLAALEECPVEAIGNDGEE